MSTNHPDKCRLPQTFWRVMDARGVPPAAIMRQARLPSTLYLNPQGIYTTEQYFAIFRAVEALIPDPLSFATAFVRGSETLMYPPSALAAFYAQNFRDALNRLARYQRLCTPAVLVIEDRENQIAVSSEWRYSASPPPTVVVDLFVAFTVELARRGTGRPIVPIRVDLVRSGPPSAALADYLACPIRYNAPLNTLIFSSADIDSPFVGHNPELLDILTPALASALMELEEPHSLPEQVKHALKQHLASGRPELSDIASSLGTSERTLQRRITEEGTTFRDLLVKARQELGRELLADPAADVDEVACMLGYQDKSSFYRAFRDWEGVTPNQWRAMNSRHHQADLSTMISG